MPKYMKPSEFTEWTNKMIRDGKAETSADCAAKLGVRPEAVSRMKNEGADLRTALACAALSSGLGPWKPEQRQMSHK